MRARVVAQLFYTLHCVILMFSEAKGQIYGSRGGQTREGGAEEFQVTICPSLSQKGYLIQFPVY